MSTINRHHSSYVPAEMKNDTHWMMKTLKIISGISFSTCEPLVSAGRSLNMR